MTSVFLKLIYAVHQVGKFPLMGILGLGGPCGLRKRTVLHVALDVILHPSPFTLQRRREEEERRRRHRHDESNDGGGKHRKRDRRDRDRDRDRYLGVIYFHELMYLLIY